MSNIFITSEKDLFGCFRIEKERRGDNETGLKDRGGIEMSTTVLHLRAAPSLAAPSLDLLTTTNATQTTSKTAWIF
jgi:hypothetical protein